MLKCEKALFSLPDSLHYLNCAYMSPLLKSVEEAGITGLKRKSNPAEITIAHFIDDVDQLREQVGALVHASPERVALIPSVSYGVALATHNMTLEKGQRAVLPGEEFPSNVHGWRDQCRETGAELVVVPRPQDAGEAGALWNEAILEAIDERTALVALTHVHWTDGTLFDLERIGKRAREVGAVLLIDGTQSIGALPFDFEAIQPDLLICAGYKWCLGPYSYCFAVLGDRFLEGRSFEGAWLHREGSEDFSRLIHYRDGFRAGARRFDVGEHANFALAPMLNESIRQILAWGVDNIQDYCRGLVERLSDALSGTEFALTSLAGQSAHLFGIHIPDESRIPGIMEELRNRQIHVSVRGSSIRVSPHVYNDMDDMDVLAKALKDVLER